MKAKREWLDPEFKARVALEAVKGIKTVQEIAMEFDASVHDSTATPQKAPA